MADDDGFIGLPPGVTPPAIDADSGTVRRERTERPRVAEREEIVFFPATPGLAPVPAPPASVEVDDATRAVPPRRHAAPVWRLLIAGHDPVPVEGTLFLGRHPVATAGHPGAHVLAVDDEAKSVSKTHAMLELDADGLWVHDLESTNGVWVVPAGQDAIEVVPGERVPVPPGADLELGDLVIRVEHG
jgi:hypothetical protein